MSLFYSVSKDIVIVIGIRMDFLKSVWFSELSASMYKEKPRYMGPCIQFCQRRQWHPTPVLLPGKSHGQRSLVGCSPCGLEESDATEWLHFHFSLWCIGEGNGNPLQCSCLENPRDGGAWWAAVFGVAQSWTRLKRLSSSSSSIQLCIFHNLVSVWTLLALHK